MRALYVSLCLCTFLSSATRAEQPHPTRARMEAVGAELKQNWSAVRDVVRRPNATNSEKSAALDAFFAHLAAVASNDGEDIVSYLAERTKAPAAAPAPVAAAELTPEQHAAGVKKIKTFIDEKSAKFIAAAEAHEKSTPELIESLREITRLTTEMVDHLAERVEEERAKVAAATADAEPKPDAASAAEDESTAVEDFVKTVRDSKFLPRADLAIQLLRDVIRLEEEKIFALIEPNADPHHRIKVSAELADDVLFIARQSRALVRLTKNLIDVGSEYFERDASTVDLRTLPKTLGEDISKTLAKVYPVLFKSADDLGVYYSKFIQTFAGLMYHYSPEEYQKLDYVQGQIPRVLPYQMVKDIVERDLGRPIEELFLTFEREPLASGSIAQVHRATIEGRRGTAPRNVVVKVKKSYVAEELAWNDRTNRLLFKYLELIAPEDTQFMVRFVTSQARELGDSFAGELDFKAELEKQHLFGRMLKTVNNISVPRPIRALSGADVITSEAIESPRRIHTAFELPRGVKSAKTDDVADATPTDATAEPATADAAAAAPTAFEAAPPLRDAVDADVTSTAAADATVTSDAKQLSGDELDAVKTIAESFMTLTSTYGYAVTPRYFQLARAVVPFASVATGYTRYGAALMAKGLKKGDPEYDVFIKTYEGLMSSFLYQVLYARELHADYNWGNVLVDPTNSVHLVDWAQTVDTRGILTQPALLFVALKFKGDADLVVKKLAQMGSFANLERDRAEITALVQKIIDALRVPKRSWFGMIKATAGGAGNALTTRSRLKKSRAAKAPAPADAVKTEVAEGDKPADVATAPKAEADETAKPGITFETSENSATVTISPAKAGTAKLAVTLAKGLLKYPYHRTRARLIRATQGAAVACDKWLGRD